MARGSPKAKKRSIPRRSVLGNDPFERGAAPRAPAPSAPRPSAPARARGDTDRRAASPDAVAPPPASVAPDVAVAAPPPASPARPRSRPAVHVPAPAPAAVERATREARIAEERLAGVVRGKGQAAYIEEVRELAVRLVPALRDRLRPLASLARIVATPASLDAHGMDARVAEVLAPFLEFLYESWWRVEVRAPHLVPPGPAVVVANHGGVAPWDALMLRAAVARKPLERDLRPLLDPATLAAPVTGLVAARLGGVPAGAEAALALLGAGTLVGVFPEGAPSSPRPWNERYRLRRFGRGGFARVAALAGVPIVPCAIVGSEESVAPFDRPGWLADAVGLPLLAAAPTLPLATLLRWIPLPTRWSIRFGTPVEPPPRDRADDPEVLAQAAEGLRATLQSLVDEDVAARRSIFL
jgi:1-acyl-sn-glycerol-3-phosphate acyltransferase